MSDKDQKEKEKAKAKKAADDKKDKEKKDEAEKRKDYDIFREPLLRYFGYSNEFCKAIRPLLPCGIGNIGSIMTICYIFTDAYDKSRRYAETYKRALKEEEKKFDKSTVQKNISITAGDALLWQSLASVLIPSFLLEKTRYVTCRILQGTGSRAMIRTVPSILTLVLIPLIINPIDNLVDVVMDNTYREWFKLDDGSGNKDKEKEKEKDKKDKKK